MKRNRSTWLFAKLTLGGALVVYVLRARMVDLGELKTFLFQPSSLLLATGLLTIGALLIATRWFVLQKSQGLTLSLSKSFHLTMIGLFFNTFMPGMVGGDVVKAWYVAELQPTQKTRALLSILVDRLVGLAVVVGVGGGTLFLFSEFALNQMELTLLSYSLWGLMGVGGILCIFILSPLVQNVVWIERVISRVSGIPILAKIVEAGGVYRKNLPALAKALALSAGQTTCIILLWAGLGKTMGIDLPTTAYFFLVPVGNIVSAIPLLPIGIGVGQVAYFTLFQWLGVAQPEQGATLCTLIQCYVILFNSIGGVFYLQYKRAA